MLLCTCESHFSSLYNVITKALSQPELCASTLPLCLHLSGVLRSNYNRTPKMSEHTKRFNSSLNEKWKPNKNYYYFDLGAPEFPGMCCCLPCCFWLKQIGRVCVTVEMVWCGVQSSLGLFNPSGFHFHFWSHLTWFSLKLPLNGLFDFADMSTWWFLHAMTQCVAETLQLCWFCSRECVQKHRQHASSTENTSGINADNSPGWELTPYKHRGKWETW